MHKKKKDTFALVMVTVIGILLFLILATAVLLFARPMIQDRFQGRAVERKLTLGKRYLSEMEYEKAVAALSDVVRIDKKNTEAYVGLGDAYSGLGKWDEAAESYDQAVQTVVERVLDGNPESRETGDTLVREEVMRKAALDDSRQEYIREKELAAINVSVDKTDGTEIVDSGTDTAVNYAEPTPEVIIQLVEKRNSATEKAIEDIEKNGGSLSPYQDYIDWREQHPYSGDKEIGNDSGSPYIGVIEKLIDEYGALRLVETNDDWDEANGLCYLQLVDFTKDGVDELFAVCKNEYEDHYTGYIYTLMNNKAREIYRNDAIEYNLYEASDIVYMGYLQDTGYIFGTGGVDDYTWDMTFFWYRDAEFKPVYHQRGYLRGDEGEEVIEEESIAVDIFDDEHEEHFWDNASEITLRYERVFDRDASVFNELQNAIDNTIRLLGADPEDLMSTDEDSKEGVDPEVNAPESDDSWKNAYAKYLESDTELYNDFTKCGFIYIDENDIPEILIDYGIEASGTRILSYKNGAVVDFHFSRLGGIHYLEREGLVYNFVGIMGVASDTLVSLDDDGFHDLGSGYRYAGEETPDYIRFEWEGKEVSEEEYMNEIESVFDVERSKTWKDYKEELNYSPYEMCDYLRS